MTSLSTPTKPEQKDINNAKSQKASFSNDEKRGSYKSRKLARNICVVFLSVVITLCAGISLFCGYALVENKRDESLPETEPAIIASEIQPVPKIRSVAVSTVLNPDFTRNVTLDCRNDDGTTDGLHYYVTDSESPDLDGLKSDITDGKATFSLSKGSYI